MPRRSGSSPSWGCAPRSASGPNAKGRARTKGVAPSSQSIARRGIASPHAGRQSRTSRRQSGTAGGKAVTVKAEFLNPNLNARLRAEFCALSLNTAHLQREPSEFDTDAAFAVVERDDEVVHRGLGRWRVLKSRASFGDGNRPRSGWSSVAASQRPRTGPAAGVFNRNYNRAERKRRNSSTALHSHRSRRAKLDH